MSVKIEKKNFETGEIKEISTIDDPDNISQKSLDRLRSRYMKNGPASYAYKVRSMKYPGSWWTFFVEVDNEEGVKLLGRPILKDNFRAKPNPPELPEKIIKRYYPKTAQEMGLYNEKKKRKKKEKKKMQRHQGGCQKCKENNPEAIEWLGIRWMGVPKPVRWYLVISRKRSWRNITGADLTRGCGCIWKLKSATAYGKKWWVTIKYASQQWWINVKNA